MMKKDRVNDPQSHEATKTWRDGLMPTYEWRSEIWRDMIDKIEEYIARVHQARVTPALDPEKVRALLYPIDFDRQTDPLSAIDFVATGLWKYQVHTPHPRYFGLFNPAPAPMGIVADALVAAFNPQLASWSHSPFAIEVEQHLIRSFGGLFGYNPELTRGTFASGGSEANHTAVLTALVDKFPEFERKGLRSLGRQPTMYVSSESHYSFLKTARLCGLGTDAVRHIPVDRAFKMNVEQLSRQIEEDRKAGYEPFLAVATAGTTSAGVIDSVGEVAGVASEHKVWLHVDAAWGGAAALVPELRPILKGIERSDSITFDAHKWLSVPMGAGLFLTCHRNILSRTFRITADYMPKEASGLEIVDPYAESIQCSRRFIGLKVFLPLLVTGWTGYAAIIEHQVSMGDLLRRQLETSDWEIVNQTPLPVVCFRDRRTEAGKTAEFLEKVVKQIVSSGKAWISTTRLNNHLPVIRACITNHLTEPEDIDFLVTELNSVRSSLMR